MLLHLVSFKYKAEVDAAARHAVDPPGAMRMV